MSTAAERTLGYGQGADTASVLTNRSKYITIIADEPFFSRRSGRTKTFPPVHLKGTRPMHRTSLTFEVCPTRTSYNSSMKSNYSGSKALQPSRRPPAYPSQHTSHFSISITPDHWLTTHTRGTFITHDVRPTYESHEHNQRWHRQMAGHDMVQSTRQNNSTEMSFDTSYTAVHDMLGRERGPGTRRQPQIRKRYDIITGEFRGLSSQEEFHRRSGNRVLHSIQQSQQYQPILD